MPYDYLLYTKEVPFVNKINIERHLIGACRKLAVNLDAAFEKRDSTDESEVLQKRAENWHCLETIFPWPAREKVPFSLQSSLIRLTNQ